MARVESVDPDQVSDDYTAKVLVAQAKTWGAPRLNHVVYARRPTVFPGTRGMWTGIEASRLIDGKLVDDELFGRPRRFFDDDALVELTAIIAWENASSKFNRALRIPSQGSWKRS